MGLVEKKKILMTGGASGIGAACARRFAEEGAAYILIVDVNEEAAKKTADAISEEFGTVCEAKRANIVNEDEIKLVFDSPQDQTGSARRYVQLRRIGRIVDMHRDHLQSSDLTMNVNARAAIFVRQTGAGNDGAAEIRAHCQYVFSGGEKQAAL